VVPLQIKGRLSEACFQEVQDKWPNILHEIKKEKITVHAWLMDGTPVGATDTQVILAFQNQIHRETTERPAHRELIEAVMNRLLGKPLTLVTLMHEEWETLGGGPANTGKETVTSRSDTEQEAERAFIAEAVKIFGADLIEIDKEGDVG
jgi:DNA polymerase-3 subunit gamma/tau